MNYISTRGGVDPISFREAVVMGLARDGGLLLPVWLILVLVGSLLWRWRINRSDAELRDRATDWERLFDLSWNDLILMRFPRLRGANPS